MMGRADIEAVLDRTLQAEKAVLGGILVDGTRYLDAADLLTPDDWFRDAHRLIWIGLQRLAAASTAIDLLTLRSVLTVEEFDRVGGAVYVASLTDGVPRASHVVHYAQQVRDAAMRRQVEQAARTLIAEAQAGDLTGEAMLERLEGVAQSVRLHQPVTGAVTPETRAADTMRTLEAIPGKRRGVLSGLREIDAMTFGFRPQQLVVLGARPSQGKTALALQLAVAAGEVGPVLFCSLEMSAEQINLRELSMRSGVSHRALDSGHITTENGAAASRGMQALLDGNVHVFDRGGQTVAQIRQAARRLALTTKQPIALIVVDYIQLMRADPGTRAENRTLEVMQFSMGLKQIAKDMHCAVVALSQLSRESERRTDKRPILADLRDSGSIEQDADIVLLLHRPGVYERDPSDTRAEVLVAKQRNGPTGIAHLRFVPHTMMFQDAVAMEVSA